MRRVIRKPQDVETIFKDSDKHMKAINNDAGWLMGELLGKCLGLINGSEYRSMRAELNPIFAHKAAATYLERIKKFTKHHIERIAGQGQLLHGTLNPVEDFKFLPFWIMIDIIYGDLTLELKDLLGRLLGLRESLWDRMMQGGATRYSWSQYFRPRIAKDLDEFKRGWATFNREAHKTCVLAREKSPIVHLYAKVNAGELDLESLLQTLDEMIFANLDVTMGGLSWNLLFLAAHQDIEDQIREEVRQARNSAPPMDDWDVYLQRSSTLLAASILESSRLKPLAAFSVPQSAPTDRVVGGFLVPAGTNYIVDTHALNMDDQYWGADAKVYRPSRFLGKKPSEMRYHFWRFGFGPRQCLGKFVVDLMSRAIVAYLVEDHRLSLAETTRWDKNPDTWIMHPDTVIRWESLRGDTMQD
jgi:gliotoxin/aspirochlorine/mycotoxins biosynthesis cytochrome P450 monooxygenase